MNPMDSTAHERVADHLFNALDSLLAASVLIGDFPTDVPDEALDAALAADEGVQEARRSHQAALRGVRDVGVGADAFLDLEATTNALAARTAEAGYRVGLRVGRGLG